MLMFLFLIQLSHHSYLVDIIGDQVAKSLFNTTEFAIIVIGIRYHPSKGITISSPYSLPSWWWPRRRLLVKSREQEPQRSVGKSSPPYRRSQVDDWARNAHSYPTRFVLHQEGLFATASKVSGSMLASVKDVITWSLKCRFIPPRSLLPLARSRNRMRNDSLAGWILEKWPVQRRCCWRMAASIVWSVV